MIIALIIACNVNFTDCKAFSSGILHKEEEACLQDVMTGIMLVEQNGYYVQDYKCLDIGTPT